MRCPFAVDAPVAGHESGSGPFVGGGAPKICHHTTEGSSYMGAYSAYHATGNLPHFTDSFEGGIYGVWQHLPLNVAASALVHPANSGHTNRDNVIQIEHVGNAATSGHWLPGYLDGIGRLCRWIEQQTGCRPEAGVSFANPVRLDWAAWHGYDGHLGHCHVPFNNHTDPGPFNIGRILAGGANPPSPSPPVAPVTITPFPEDNMRRIDITVPGLDGQGHGYTDLPVPAGTVVSVRVNSSDYHTIPDSNGDQDQGGNARIEWNGPANSPAFAARVWVTG